MSQRNFFWNSIILNDVNILCNFPTFQGKFHQNVQSILIKQVTLPHTEVSSKSMKTDSRYDVNFVVTGGTIGCQWQLMVPPVITKLASWQFQAGFQWMVGLPNASQEFCTLFMLCCVLLCLGSSLFYPYPSELLSWHWGNPTNRIAPVPEKQPWRIWVNYLHHHHDSSCDNNNVVFIKCYCQHYRKCNHNKGKHNKTVHISWDILYTSFMYIHSPIFPNPVCLWHSPNKL